MTETRTLDTPAGPRTYLVHVPSAGGPLPLVMMLHGTGGTAPWTLGETRWDATADAHGFLLVLPEAMPRDPTRPPSFLDNPPVWNDGAPEGPSAGATADDVGFLTAVLDDVARHHPIDPQRVYLTGFSNGAAMAFRFASERAERLAALAPVAGHCWIDPRPARPVPTLYLIGDSDPLFPLAGGEVVLPWGRTRSRRPPVSWTLERWARAIGPSAELRSVTVPGLGHHWPGGRGQLSRRLAGQPSDRLDANETIWESFRNASAPGER